MEKIFRTANGKIIVKLAAIIALFVLYNFVGTKVTDQMTAIVLVAIITVLIILSSLFLGKQVIKTKYFKIK